MPAKPCVRVGGLSHQSALEVFAFALERRLTGTIVFEELGVGTHAVAFHAGVPARVRLARREALLGEELVRSRAIEAHVVARAVLESRREGVRLGDWLVLHRGVERSVIEHALRRQVVARAARLADLRRETAYYVYPGHDFVDDGGGEPWPSRPLDALLAAARSMRDPARVKAIVAPLSWSALGLREPRCPDLTVSAVDAILLAAIARTHPTLMRLLGMGLASEHHVVSLVATLHLGRHLVAVPDSWSSLPSGPDTVRSCISGRARPPAG